MMLPSTGAVMRARLESSRIATAFGSVPARKISSRAGSIEFGNSMRLATSPEAS